MQAGKKATPSRGTRRTQSERTEAMRKRLIDATVTCLANEGYAGVTIAKVAELAGVSNGTPLHHFENKASLLANVAEYLLDWIYRKGGELYSSLHNDADWVTAIVERSWSEIFNTVENQALLEIILASRREPSLDEVVQPLFPRARTAFLDTTRSRFETVGETHNLDDLSMLIQWMFRGMAMEAHMIDAKQQKHYLNDIAQLLLQHIRPTADADSSSPSTER